MDSIRHPQVMQARKKFAVEYPALYADKDNCKDEKARETFNCIQRAHQNCLENLPTFMGLLAITGAKVRGCVGAGGGGGTAAFSVTTPLSPSWTPIF